MANKLDAATLSWAQAMNAHMPVLPWKCWYIWVLSEGEPGGSHNNPLNIPYYDFLAPYGATDLGPDLAGTAAFPSQLQGLTATLHALDGTLPFDDTIRAIFPAARSSPGDALPILRAIERSNWAASHYYSALVDRFVYTFGLQLPKEEWGH